MLNKEIVLVETPLVWELDVLRNKQLQLQYGDHKGKT